jgi:flagellar biosynthesis protein FliR
VTLSELVAGFLIFARIGGLFMTLPGLSAEAVPAWSRLAAALPLTVVLLPAVDAPEVPGAVGALVASVITEAFVGAAMGLGVAMVYGAFTAAADLIGTKMGLNVGSMLDPLTHSTQGPLAAMASWLATGVFFATDIHLQCIRTLATSLHILPPGGALHPLRAGAVLTEAVAAVGLVSLQLAGPIVAFLFLVNLALMVLGRMAPNLQLFFGIGVSLTVTAGLVLLAVSLPALLSVYAQTLATAPGWMLQVLEVVRG